MVGIEKEILLVISRIRCMTETQAGKIFNAKKRHGRKPFKKTLRKMCNEYTLRKYPCNINYGGYKDNSYVYYLNGSQVYRGKDLAKVVIGSELVIKIEAGGCEIRRFYRNAKVDDDIYDIFIEYIDQYGDLKQLLVDIDLDNNVKISKYKYLDEKINNSTIPFFQTPRVLIITSSNIENELRERSDHNIDFIDLSLNKLFRHI